MGEFGNYEISQDFINTEYFFQAPKMETWQSIEAKCSEDAWLVAPLAV